MAASRWVLCIQFIPISAARRDTPRSRHGGSALICLLEKIKSTADAIIGIGLRFPSPAPPTPAATPAAHQPNHNQEQHGADGGVDDGGDNAGPEVDAELRQEPVADERADYADDEIADESEPGTA